MYKTPSDAQPRKVYMPMGFGLAGVVVTLEK
jgi:hypothetical protein